MWCVARGLAKTSNCCSSGSAQLARLSAESRLAVGAHVSHQRNFSSRGAFQRGQALRLAPSSNRFPLKLLARKASSARLPSFVSVVPPTSSPSFPGNRKFPKKLVPPLPVFQDHRYPGPEPHVGAFFLRTAIDLHQLKARFQELDCPTILFQGILLAGGSAELGQQKVSSVALADGCLICWHMNRKTELMLQKLAASCPGSRRGPTDVTVTGRPETYARMGQLGLAAPLSEERLDVMDAHQTVISSVDAQEGSVWLTRDPQERQNHQLGVSLGLAVAVRVDALERQIEAKLDENWREISREGKNTIFLAAVSHRIFIMESGLHDLRYELNSEAGHVDAPEVLWEHSIAERLYEQVLTHHDTRKRTALLNERLSYSFDYLRTLSEHVRHQYSVRLEVIIIILIFFELCVGIMSMLPGSGGGHGRLAVNGNTSDRCEDENY